MTVTVLATQATDIAANETAARQAQMNSHLAALDPHADRILAAQLALGRFHSPLATAALSALQSGDSTASSFVSGGNVLNTQILVPMYAAEQIVLRPWQVNVAAGVATAVYRVGVWSINDQGHPFRFTIGSNYATLLTAGDLGTIDCSATGASPTIATAITIPQGTWWAISGGAQTALATLTIGQAAAGRSGPFGSTAAPATNGSAGIGLAMSGVSGALPANFAPTSLSSLGHGVCFGRTA